jgi:hypothetical protein
MKFKMGSAKIKATRKQPGGSNVGKKTFANGKPRTGPYVGPSGGSPKGSYPIPDKAHAKAAIKMSGHAPNPSGIKSAVYNKYPELKPENKKMCGSKGMKYVDGTDGTKPVIRTKDVGKVQAYNDSLNAYNNYQSIANDKSLDNRRYGYAFNKKLNKEELTKDYTDRGLEDPTKTYALKGNEPIGAIKRYNPTAAEMQKDPSLRKYGIGSEQFIMEYAKPQQPYEQEKLPGGSGKFAQYPNMKKQSNSKTSTSSRMVNGKKVSGIANTFKEGTKAIKFKGKEMMKRADGSTSQRGLWDNIRANKGSGKKPTPEMLKQEKKIKAKTGK